MRVIEMVIAAILSTGAHSLYPQGSSEKTKKFLERVIFISHFGQLESYL
jgi:hypothetical protein